MVPNATEEIDITQMSEEQLKNIQENSIMSEIFGDTEAELKNCTLLPSRYKKPVLTQLEINFFNFVQGRCLPFKIETAEDFPRWLEDLSYYLRYLGLPTVVSEIIDAITENRSIRFQPDEDMVIKQLIMASCASNAVFGYGTTAQQTLYNVIHSLGLIKAYEEIYTMIDEFAIDIREPEYAGLRKFNVLQFICKISNTPINSKTILRNIVRSFPQNRTFQPLALLVGEFLAKNEKVEVGEVIKEIYEKVREMCIIRPLESIFDFSNSDSISIVASGSNNDHNEKTNNQKVIEKSFNKFNNFNGNKVGKNRVNDPLWKDFCIHCCNQHSSRNCPNRWNGVCSWCDTYGHKRKHCLAKRINEAEKEVEAVLSTEAGRDALIEIIKKDENLRASIINGN
ncbi:hypothetical protein CANINC_000095 [Pichia inconspicua]|uniref:Uncharacterized protein n=1 Tax=Pichia inconspicua TaxID=52247 RepID=A0A4T0X8D1_9ASCO|nr:hypothetical protein CANINC_000095 [[Candida] inconspicua]